jgi:hypothetical protein
MMPKFAAIGLISKDLEPPEEVVLGVGSTEEEARAEASNFLPKDCSVSRGGPGL